MHKQLIVPSLGEKIAKVQVAKVLVAVGAPVTAETPVLEVEADKAVVEIPAAAAGVIRQLLVSPGDMLKVGQAFAVLEAAPAAPDAAPVVPPDPEEPHLASTAPSAAVNRPAAAPPADSAATTAAEPPTPPADSAATTAAEPPTPPADSAASTTAALASAPAAPLRTVPHVPAAPSVRRFAREIGLDVDTVTGSGPHGRVSIEDVKRHARELHTARHEPGLVLSEPPLPDFTAWGPVRRESMSSIRFATAQQVTRCWLNIPRVTHFDSADITELEVLRKRYKPRAEAAGGNLTMAVMVVKVVAEALRKFPKLNASVDMASRQIILKESVHIGIAVATERGLMVPVLRDADRKSMVHLAAEIDRVAKRCREGKITLEELQGGTFTVTNLGSIGGSWFTPIVNWPEVAILGLGRAAEQVALRDGQPTARVLLPLSLSYDHRLIDGADAARFVRWIAEAIEEPLLLTLEGAPR
jgi:pyruvate dehydrogenase E2 component (dihydrolipoamide acetyltransferase)